MIDLGQLAKLWSAPTPRTVGGRCLNARHRARDCRICVEACPVNAISIPDQGGPETAPIALDPNTCVRCGVCLNVCPTGVFAQTEPPETKLSHTLARFDSQDIELACPRKEAPDLAAPGAQAHLSQLPTASVLQTPRCLGALSAPALLELATTGKSVWLNDSICHTCPIGEAKQTIQRTISTANRWLQAMGYSPVIRSLEASEELAAEPIPRPVVRAERHVMSRRDFIKSLAGQTPSGAQTERQGSASARPSPVPPPGSRSPGETQERSGRRLTHYIPAQRQHLAHALRRLSPAPETHVVTDGLPIADVTISEACTACGLCAKFCPTEAITFLSDGAYYVLHFSAALCLGKDCCLCRIGCPTDAVRFGHEVIADELLSTQPRPLKAGRLAPCPQCGALTDAPTEGDHSSEVPLCYICRAQSQRPNFTTEVIKSHPVDSARWLPQEYD